MKANLLRLVLIAAVGCANAGEIEKIKDQEKAWILSEVSILMYKNDPREFPAIIRLVSLPVPLGECEPDFATEDVCPQKDLYLVLSNWDIAADIHAFRIGRADAWRVGELVLRDRRSQSFWSAHLSVEADGHANSKKVTEAISIKITNTADEYSLEMVGNTFP